jgi:regulator of protease activity HflC (stomatin/prohibitin superfamily)
LKSRLRILTLALATLSIAFGTGCTRIGPGHAGIVVNQAGSDRGVLNQSATTGWVFYNPFSKTVIEYQTSMRNAKWTKDTNEGHPVNEEISFTNQDSMKIDTDIGISFSLDPSKVPAFYVKFLATDEDDLDAKFTNGYLRNAVRNCLNDHAGRYTIAQIMGDNAQFLKDSQDCIQSDVAKYGVHVDQFGLLGAPRPPQQVIDSINSKSQAEQISRQKQLELTQVQADAAKRVAEAQGEAQATLAVAEAQAQANRKLAESLSDNLIRYKAIEKWDGQRPTVEGSQAGLLFNLNK